MEQTQKNRTLICTAGTSVFQLRKHLNLTLKDDHFARELNRTVIKEAGYQQLISGSAELTTIEKIQPVEQVWLLSTDTEEGRLAASIVKHLAVNIFPCRCEVKQIKHLDLNNPDMFLHEGLRNLFSTIDSIAEKQRNAGSSVFLSIAGGTKTTVCYVTLYAMLRQLPVIFTFESGSVKKSKTEQVEGKPTRDQSVLNWDAKLVKLPPLPIALDVETILSAGKVIKEIEEKSSLPVSEVRMRLGHNYDALALLFEEDHGEVSFSPFGFMFLQDMHNAEQTTVMLSPSAKKTYINCHKVERMALDNMLSKIKIAQMRVMHKHAFSGTDLDVYKPGNVSQRLAYWMEQNVIYIAELYPSHDRDYEVALSKKKRADYQPRTFEHWNEPDDRQGIMSHEFDAIKAEYLKLEKENEKLEKAHNKTERELIKSHKKEQMLCKERDTMKKEIASLKDKIVRLEARRTIIKRLELPLLRNQ